MARPDPIYRPDEPPRPLPDEDIERPYERYQGTPSEHYEEPAYPGGPLRSRGEAWIRYAAFGVAGFLTVISIFFWWTWILAIGAWVVVAMIVFGQGPERSTDRFEPKEPPPRHRGVHRYPQPPADETHLH